MVVGQLKFYTYEGCTCAIFVPSFVGINKANTMAVVAGLDILSSKTFMNNFPHSDTSCRHSLNVVLYVRKYFYTFVPFLSEGR